MLKVVIYKQTNKKKKSSDIFKSCGIESVKEVQGKISPYSEKIKDGIQKLMFDCALKNGLHLRYGKWLGHVAPQSRKKENLPG